MRSHRKKKIGSNMGPVPMFLFSFVFFSLGVFMSQITYTSAEATIPQVKKLLCSDGQSMRSKWRSHDLDASAVMQLGELGRRTFKTCLCNGFQSGVCLALQMELEDSI